MTSQRRHSRKLFDRDRFIGATLNGKRIFMGLKVRQQTNEAAKTLLSRGVLILLLCGANAEVHSDAGPLVSAEDQQVRSLDAGKHIEREIAPGETHHYQIALEAGQFLHVNLDRRGSNLYMALLDPGRKRLIEVNRAPYPLGLVPILLVSETAGSCRLEVRLPVADPQPGRYRVGIEELRTANDTDRSRVRAEWTFIEAQQLSEQGSAQSQRKSIDKHVEALSLYRTLGERGGEARALNFIGLAHSELGDNRKALEYYAQSLPLYRAVGEKGGEATVLNNIGLAYSRLSDPGKAIENFNRAVVLRRAVGDRQGEAITLNNIGAAYLRLSEYRKALNYLNQALPIYQAIGHRRLEAGALYNVGQAYASLGEWRRSQECFAKALPVAQAVGNQRLEANILVAIGAVYSILGEHPKALDSYTLALPLHRDSGNRVGEANALVRIGRVSRLSGDNQKALDHFNRSLMILRGVGDRRGEANALRDIGQLHGVLGESQKALDLLNQALPIARAAGNREVEAGVLNDIGSIHASLSEYQKALDYLNQALAIYRSIGNRGNEAQALYNIARAYRGQGNLVAARSHSDAALRVVESQRIKVDSPESRASYFASMRELYDLDIDLLMQLSKQDSSQRFDFKAIETSERARARGLLELLAEARADIRQGVDTVLLERERSLGELLNAKAERQTQLLSGKHTPEEAAATAREMEGLLTEYQQVQGRIRATSPRYASLTQPEPLNLSEIQQQVLDADTLLLQYALGDERSYLWAVSPASISSYELPKREQIEETARRFYELARTNANIAEVEEAAAALTGMLVAPVADRLQSKRLLIVPDGALHYVPFAALPGPVIVSQRGNDVDRSARYRPLIADHEIVVLPSVSVLAEIRRDLTARKIPAKAVAILADPVFSHDDPRLKSRPNATQATAETTRRDLQRAMADLGVTGSATATFPRLPFSRREAEAITALVPAGQSKKSLDFQASRDTATNGDLSGYRVIHFATHGLLNNTHPELSGIVLSLVDSNGQPQDGFLRLHEVYNLKMPADLVVLSACQTGLGKEFGGEGLVGLTRGFMYAGASRVVASLWKVDDAATAELMKRFYHGVFGKRLRPAAALREAQVEMHRQERWRYPYFWAAFVLQGEYR